MNRVGAQWMAEEVGYALGYVPERLVELAGCDFFFGDPWFAGLHRLEVADNGEPTAIDQIEGCAVNAPWACDRRTTVVIRPERGEKVVTILHELAHVIEFELYDRSGGRVERMEPVNEYGSGHHGEAFAESFVQWLYGAELVEKLLGMGRERWWGWSQPNAEWWDRLMLR